MNSTNQTNPTGHYPNPANRANSTKPIRPAIPPQPVHRSLYIIGLIFSCVMAGLSIYLAVFTIRDNPECQQLFGASLLAEIAAAMLFVPLLAAEDLANAGRFIISDRVKTRLSGTVYFLSLILALFGAVRLYLRDEDFLATMAFVVYPSALFTLVCVWTLASSFLRRPAAE